MEDKKEDTRVENKLRIRLASRRFIIIMSMLSFTTLLMWKAKIDVKTFESILIWLSGIYVIGKPFGDLLGRFSGNFLNK